MRTQKHKQKLEGITILTFKHSIISHNVKICTYFYTKRKSRKWRERKHRDLWTRRKSEEKVERERRRKGMMYEWKYILYIGEEWCVASMNKSVTYHHQVINIIHSIISGYTFYLRRRRRPCWYLQSKNKKKKHLVKYTTEDWWKSWKGKRKLDAMKILSRRMWKMYVCARLDFDVICIM